MPVAGVAGDQQAALFGQACLDPGLGKNTYGTGSFVLLNTGAVAPAPARGLLGTVACGDRQFDYTYALEAAIFVTGAAIQWLRDGLGVIATAAETEALAASVDGNDGVYFVPALTGSARRTGSVRARHDRRDHPGAPGERSSCGRPWRRSPIRRSMRSGRSRPGAGWPSGELRVDGGAVGNAWLMQFQADILGVPVVVPEITETTALGAASVAGVGVGLWSLRMCAGGRRARAALRADDGRRTTRKR